MDLSLRDKINLDSHGLITYKKVNKLNKNKLKSSWPSQQTFYLLLVFFIIIVNTKYLIHKIYNTWNQY